MTVSPLLLHLPDLILLIQQQERIFLKAISDTRAEIILIIHNTYRVCPRTVSEQMKKFVRMAKTELIIIDPYFADCVLPLIAQKRQGVAVLVVKNSRNKMLHAVDVAKFNAQYANSLTVKTSDKFHDRFLIFDKTTLIHVGASLNHLGKKCFAFSSLDKSNIPDILAKL